MYEAHLKSLSDTALRLYLCLLDLAAENPSHKMTVTTLADRARIPVADVAPAQAQLEERGLVEREKSRIVRVGQTACSLSFTKDRDRELETLRKENEELRAKLKAYEQGSASGLADVLGPNAASVVYAAEDVLGRALTYEETWYLGGLVAEYKSRRVRDVIYSQREAKNPLRATYAILKNGAKGKPFREKETEDPIEYPKLTGDDPWT